MTKRSLLSERPSYIKVKVLYNMTPCLLVNKYVSLERVAFIMRGYTVLSSSQDEIKCSLRRSRYVPDRYTGELEI